jgi:hypothetical protein
MVREERGKVVDVQDLDSALLEDGRPLLRIPAATNDRDGNALPLRLSGHGLSLARPLRPASPEKDPAAPETR